MAPKEGTAYFKFSIREKNIQGLADALARSMKKLKIFQENNNNNIILRDRYGNTWQLKRDIVGSVGDGSEKFVRDNSIEVGDVLFCMYEGNNVFEFHPRDALDNFKIGVGCSLPKNEERVDAMDEEHINEDNDTEKGSAEEEEENEETSKGEAKVGRAIATSKHARKRDLEVADIFKSGRACVPKYPYFVKKFNIKQEDVLFIPMNFSTDNEIELPEKPFLIDSDGRRWRTELKTWRDGRASYRRGWKLLCERNNVRENDEYVCEFISLRNEIDIRVII